MRPLVRTLAASTALAVALGGAALPQSPPPPASPPADTALPEAIAARLDALDHRVALVKDLVAEFRQERHTPILKKPLVSEGNVKVLAGAALWTTTAPDPVVMRIDPKELRIYFPQDKLVEVYPLDARLGDVAASPLPRLEALRRNFIVAERAGATTRELLALRLVPRDPALAKTVQHVDIDIDEKDAALRRCEIVEGEGNRTVLAFSKLRKDVGLKDADVALTVPADVRVVAPLASQPKADPPAKPPAESAPKR